MRKIHTVAMSNINNINGGVMNRKDNHSRKIKTPTQRTSRMIQVVHTTFPVYKCELKKFILMGSINFFIIMALTLTRDTKDTMVVTQCGAEAISFLKIYGVLPAATAFLALYSKAASLLEQRSLFFATCIPFFLFFLVFDLLVYPNRELLHPSYQMVKSVIGANGGAKELVCKLLSHWTSALYYVVAELYSSVSVGILFWQFANEVIPVHEAKRLYPLFAQIGSIAPIFAGQFNSRYASKANDFGQSLHRLTMAITFSGIMICTFYQLSYSLLLKENTRTQLPKPKPIHTKHDKNMSVRQSLRLLASSQYLRLIVTMVLGYGFTSNLTEVLWKSLLKKQYPDPLQYQTFQGNFSSAVGVVSCIAIFFGAHVIRVFGWRVGAMTTPLCMAMLAVPFFGCIFLGLDQPEHLRLAVLIGTVHTLVNKACKNALFDPLTQMAYIPLDKESKVKGKAAIDVLGTRLGKSGSALFQQGLMLLYTNIIDASSAIVVVYSSILFGWIAAVNTFSGLFMQKSG